MVIIGIGEAPWAESPNRSDLARAVFLLRAPLEVDTKPVVREGKPIP